MAGNTRTNAVGSDPIERLEEYRGLHGPDWELIEILERDAARVRINDRMELPRSTPTANHIAATTTRAAALPGGDIPFPEQKPHPHGGS